MPEPRIGALILAAGRGTRFGPGPKLLAMLDGEPLVRHVAKAALASSARPVVVVLGAHPEAVSAALDGLTLRVVENLEYAAGLSSSLRAGLAALPDEIDAVVVLLGDMPRITVAHLDGLIAAYRDAEIRPGAAVPVSAGRRGNPVLLNLRKLAEPLQTLSGDRGAGPLLAGRDDVIEVEMDGAVAFDVDTPAALADG